MITYEEEEIERIIKGDIKAIKIIAIFSLKMRVLLQGNKGAIAFL